MTATPDPAEANRYNPQFSTEPQPVEDKPKSRANTLRPSIRLPELKLI